MLVKRTWIYFPSVLLIYRLLIILEITFVLGNIPHKKKLLKDWYFHVTTLVAAPDRFKQNRFAAVFYIFSRSTFFCSTSLCSLCGCDRVPQVRHASLTRQRSNFKTHQRHRSVSSFLFIFLGNGWLSLANLEGIGARGIQSFLHLLFSTCFLVFFLIVIPSFSLLHQFSTLTEIVSFFSFFLFWLFYYYRWNLFVEHTLLSLLIFNCLLSCQVVNFSKQISVIGYT